MQKNNGNGSMSTLDDNDCENREKRTTHDEDDDHVIDTDKVGMS